MLKKLTGKGKKKDSTPPHEEPLKSKRPKRGLSKSGPGGSSHSQPQVPPPPVLTINQSEVPLPPHLQPWSDKFYRQEALARYTQIKAFNFNQEKGFAVDLLRGVPEISEELHRRKWNERHEFKAFVRGVEIDFSADAINAFLGTTSRRQIRDFVSWPHTRWMSYGGGSYPTKIRLRDFKPVARAWAEFWVKNVEVVGNSSEYQVDNAAAVKVIFGREVCGFGALVDLISALCRAKKVLEDNGDGGLHPIKGLSLGYFNKKYERGEVIYLVEPGEEGDAAVQEEEELNQFEDVFIPINNNNKIRWLLAIFTPSMSLPPFFPMLSFPTKRACRICTMTLDPCCTRKQWIISNHSHRLLLHRSTPLKRRGMPTWRMRGMSWQLGKSFTLANGG
ncbi:hypothetical protein A2U01_0007400, partial [Trifolium medium]|nr:hypothetical protein [Trifolium medium]